jgi:class 3 adenylate cyclase
VTDLPTGTVTFLFTDIEGSTRLWEQHPEVMPATLARHDALLRATIQANQGHVFKTAGDSFCAAFAQAPDALAAALDAQRALRAEGWSDFAHSGCWSLGEAEIRARVRNLQEAIPLMPSTVRALRRDRAAVGPDADPVSAGR